MTCDVIRNRLLALPDLARLPDDLRAHLTECEACFAWLAKARKLDAAIANLSAPSSAEAKAAFLDYLAADGPIIKAVPSVGRPAGFSLATLTKQFDWRVVSGLAAAALVGVGIWAFSGGGKPIPEVAGPKHELLARGVDFVAAMSSAKTPQERARASVAMAGDLRTEVKDLYLNAPVDDLDKLAELYEKVVDRGLVPQSEQLVRVPVQERHAVWQQVRAHFAGVAKDAAEMQTRARPEAVPSLKRIQQSALAGQAKVDHLITNGGV
jgi:hypothetical protein